MSKRPSRHEWFMRHAYLAAAMSTCLRRQVGCILVRHKHIIATGYNGSLPGAPHCDEQTCNEHNPCERTIHAESNAVAQAARYGHNIEDTVAYVTMMPCQVCMKLLIAAGVGAVIYSEDYRCRKAELVAHSANISLNQLKETEYEWT